MKALILTAGLGTRLRPLTDQFAKPALPLWNVPMLHFTMDPLFKFGIRDWIFNLHYRPEQIRATAQSFSDNLGSVYFSEELEKPLGSAGALYQARERIGSEDFILANGDELMFPANDSIWQDALAEHKASGALATIFVIKHPEVGTKFGGVWSDSSGRVHGFGKANPFPQESLQAYHYVGYQILNPRILDFIPPGESNIFYDIQTKAIAAGEKVRVFEIQAEWHETGHFADYLNVQLDILRGRFANPKILQTLEELSRQKSKLVTSGDAVMWVGENCKIDANARLRGAVVLGANVHLGSGVEIENCVVWPGTNLQGPLKKSNAVLF